MEVVKGPDNNVDLISQWIRTYEKDLLRLCCVYLKDVSLAEDAVQETFLKAYSHLPSFRGNSSPKTWLVRIAINVCTLPREACLRQNERGCPPQIRHGPQEKPCAHPGCLGGRLSTWRKSGSSPSSRPDRGM